MFLQGTNVQTDNCDQDSKMIKVYVESEKENNNNINNNNNTDQINKGQKKAMNEEDLAILQQNKQFNSVSFKKLSQILKTAHRNNLVGGEFDQIPEMNPDQEQDYKVYNMRFLVCILYYLSDFCMSMQSATFTTIAAILVQVYDSKPIFINLTSLVQFIVIPIVTPFANSVIDKYGMSTSVKIGVVFALLGSWMRVFIDEFFSIIILGSVLNAFGGPFVFNVKTKIAANWFRPQVWPKVTTFISYSVLINSICGIVLPGLWFSGYKVEADKLTNYSEGKKLIYQLLIFYAIIITMFSALILIFLKDKPPTPPSFTATVKREENIKIATRELLKNSNYMKLLFALSLAFGSYTGVIVSISFLVQPFGFDQSDTSLMIAIVPVTATIGIIVGQKILVQGKNYRLFISCAFALQALITQCLIFMMEAGKLWVNIIGMGILGFFALPSVPAGYEYASELAFPVGEGSAIGYVIGMAGINGFVFGLIFSEIIQGQTKLQSYIGITILNLLFVVSVLFICWTKLDNKRTKIEEQRTIILSHQPIRSFSLNKSFTNSLNSRSSFQNSLSAQSPDMKQLKIKTNSTADRISSVLPQENKFQNQKKEDEFQEQEVQNKNIVKRNKNITLPKIEKNKNNIQKFQVIQGNQMILQ